MAKIENQLIASRDELDKDYVLVSLCVCGVPCRYHGKTHKMGYRLFKEKKIAELKEKYNLIPICPEIMGGLPTPRCPCDVKWDGENPKIINRITGEAFFQGINLTSAYLKGAQWTLWMAHTFGCTKAYLLRGSPACDSKDGVAGRLLKRNSIIVTNI